MAFCGKEKLSLEQEEIIDLGVGGLKLLQNRRYLCLSEDTVRLAEFAVARATAPRRVCELGSGNGGLAFALWARLQVPIVGVEVMPNNVDLARRSLAMNAEQVGEQVRFVCADWRDWAEYLTAGEFDLLVSNPPFWAQNKGRLSPVRERRAATHELHGGLLDMLCAAHGLLAVGGDLCLLLPSERDAEVARLLADTGFKECEREYFARRVLFWAEKC